MPLTVRLFEDGTFKVYGDWSRAKWRQLGVAIRLEASFQILYRIGLSTRDTTKWRHEIVRFDLACPGAVVEQIGRVLDAHPARRWTDARWSPERRAWVRTPTHLHGEQP